MQAGFQGKPLWQVPSRGHGSCSWHHFIHPHQDMILCSPLMHREGWVPYRTVLAKRAFDAWEETMQKPLPSRRPSGVGSEELTVICLSGGFVPLKGVLSGTYYGSLRGRNLQAVHLHPTSWVIPSHPCGGPGHQKGPTESPSLKLSRQRWLLIIFETASNFLCDEKREYTGCQ